MLKNLVGDKAFYRRLFMVMLPILVQNVITNFVSLLDNVMVGQVGTEPMSGVAIVNQLLFVFNVCIFGGLAGAGIFTAQYFGKNDENGVRDTFRMKFYIAIVASALFTAAFILFGEQLIKLFLHEGDANLDLAATLEYGKSYFKVMLIQIFPFAIMQVYASTLRETGETILPMKAGIAAVLINLVLNYILIFGKLGLPAMGVVGAAIATVIARFAECFIVIFWTHRHKQTNPYVINAFASFKVPRQLSRQVIKLGAPLLLNEILWATAMAVLNQCYSLRGLEAVSATNIASTVSNLFFCAFFAMGNTVAIIVGQLLGSGDLERAVDEDKKLIAFSVTLSAGVGIMMAVLAPLIPQVYNTTDTVKAIACDLLIVSAVMMPVNAFTNCAYFTMRSGGKTMITFVFDCGFEWLIPIPVAFFLSRYTGVGIVQMYTVVQALVLIKAIVGFILVKNRSWVKNLVAE